MRGKDVYKRQAINLLWRCILIPMNRMRQDAAERFMVRFTADNMQNLVSLGQAFEFALSFCAAESNGF